MSLEDLGDKGRRAKSQRATEKPRGDTKPTLKTIAELTGLAVTTVSHALADAPQIALETRQRVRKVASDIGYLPDRAAQRLRTGRTNVISLILDPHEEILGYATSMINGLTEALRGTAYHLVITPHFSDTPQIDPVRHIMRNRMADGIVFTRTEPADERVKLLMENNFPFICHGRTELATAHPYVDYDNYSFAYKAAKKLIAAGARKLSIILPPERFTFAHHLKHGFMTAVREEGVGFEIAKGVTLDSKSDDIRDYLFRRMAEPERPDGYICGGEVSALAVMASAYDHRLELGQDIRLVAKQTSGLFDQIRPRVETIYEDLTEAGLLMGKLLLKRIAGPAPVAELQALQTV
ncbi:LacI family transcriptional regulator [Neorhizobium galegae]|uniref:HTH-type transcriptional regulator AglR n=1 Tax=Neorhizobium galegae bv. orientalis str. HAMBI 540 TaxID=1028800 RepID=A0A068ST68_NEOGA|nr:LacI family transcriptional regulator [Neorhizobium galegae]CDN49497.1 HTH-type transcriptional regulator AglR [Neorhizobium galegae bv. orientalis str. HAMBI 540]CDZ47029.1 HTH-type transcriptional regulator RafR [Neorhizobium galegae bv. orientalis]